MNGMRSLVVVLAMSLAACGGGVTLDGGVTQTGHIPQNGSCTDDYQCESGLVCEGCGPDTPKECVIGCRADYQCGPDQTCHPVYCFQCPCPPMCG